MRERKVEFVRIAEVSLRLNECFFYGARALLTNKSGEGRGELWKEKEEGSSWQRDNWRRAMRRFAAAVPLPQ